MGGTELFSSSSHQRVPQAFSTNGSQIRHPYRGVISRMKSLKILSAAVTTVLFLVGMPAHIWWSGQRQPRYIHSLLGFALGVQSQ